eukprot:9967474-Ditylum_brightwellii.AAC.1
MELSGILSALYPLRAFTEFSNTAITSAPPLLCNNSAAVSRTEKPIYPGICEHLAADYDLYKEIALVATIVKVKPAWVKAHQDKTKCMDDLPLEARLNIQADSD